MPRLAAAAVLLVLLLAACGETTDVGGPVDDPEQPLPVEPDEGIGDGAEPPAGATSVTGTLGGDADLEGGCAWVDGEDGTRYEVQYPAGHEVRFDPLELVGPDGDVIAAEGDTVTITGAVAEDMMSFCQVGTIFTATAVEA
jgi:hypothetical protein